MANKLTPIYTCTADIYNLVYLDMLETSLIWMEQQYLARHSICKECLHFNLRMSGYQIQQGSWYWSRKIKNWVVQTRFGLGVNKMFKSSQVLVLVSNKICDLTDKVQQDAWYWYWLDWSRPGICLGLNIILDPRQVLVWLKKICGLAELSPFSTFELFYPKLVKIKPRILTKMDQNFTE